MDNGAIRDYARRAKKVSKFEVIQEIYFIELRLKFARIISNQS